MLKTLGWVVIFVIGVAFADEIEDAIIKDLDFFMNLEVVENEELANNWAKFDKEEKPAEEKKK